MITPLPWAHALAAWLIVLSGALVVLAIAVWVATDALRRVLLCAGLWRDFVLWAIARRIAQRAESVDGARDAG